jgi:hypothetical protein
MHGLSRGGGEQGQSNMSCVGRERVCRLNKVCSSGVHIFSKCVCISQLALMFIYCRFRHIAKLLARSQKLFFLVFDWYSSCQKRSFKYMSKILRRTILITIYSWWEYCHFMKLLWSLLRRSAMWGWHCNPPETVSETFDSSAIFTWLITQENLIAFGRHESLKSYILNCW